MPGIAQGQEAPAMQGQGGRFKAAAVYHRTIRKRVSIFIITVGLALTLIFYVLGWSELPET